MEITSSSKPYIPDGIAESEFITIVEKAAMPSCYKFKWGFNDINDMKHQSMLIAIELMGYTLQVCDNLPESGYYTAAITAGKNLHIRLFDKNGDIVIDKKEHEMNKSHVRELKSELACLKGRNWDWRSRVLLLIYQLTGHKPVTCKFKPRGDKPIALQLSNFLRVWLYNRLSNWRRDKCCRYPNKGGSNQTKFYLNYPIHYHSTGMSKSELFADNSNLPESIGKEEIISHLTAKLHPSELHLYEKYVSNYSLTEEEELKLYKAVRRCLPGTKEDYL